MSEHTANILKQSVTKLQPSAKAKPTLRGSNVSRYMKVAANDNHIAKVSDTPAQPATTLKEFVTKGSNIPPPPAKQPLHWTAVDGPQVSHTALNPPTHTRKASLKGSRIPLPVPKQSNDPVLQQKWKSYLASTDEAKTNANDDRLTNDENISREF